MALPRNIEGVLWTKTFALWREMMEECVSAFGGDVTRAAEYLGVSKSFMFQKGRELGADIFGKRPRKEAPPRPPGIKRKQIKGRPRVHMTSAKEKEKAAQAMAKLEPSS